MANDDGVMSFEVGAMTVEVERMQVMLDTGSCKAFVKIRFKTAVGSIAVDNFRLIESKKGEMFVAPPSHKKGEKYYDDVEVTGDLAKYLRAAVLRKYQEEAPK